MRTSNPEPAAAAASRSRARLWIAETVAAVMIVVYGLEVPPGSKIDIDHLGALQTLAAMRKGKGYYQAFRDSYLSRGVRLGGARSFRTPYLFLMWREVPAHLLYPFFLVAVVGVSTFFLMRCTVRPIVVVPVTLFLLFAGRTPGGSHGGLDGWLLVELWTVPLLAASTWAWNRDKRWTAAMTAAGAVLIRELTLPVVLIGLLLSWRRGKSMKPWLTALAIDIVGWSIHIYLAAQVGVKHGNETKLWGTGKPLWSVYYMTIYPLTIFKGTTKIDVLFGVSMWVLALWVAWRERDRIPPTVGVLAIPLMGLLVSRPYWGLPMIPLALFWAFDDLARRLVEPRRPRRGAVPRSTDGDEATDGNEAEVEQAHEPAPLELVRRGLGTTPASAPGA